VFSAWVLSQRGSLQRQQAQSQAARQSVQPNLHHALRHHEMLHPATPNRDRHAAHEQSVHQRHVRSDPHERRALNVLIGQPERRVKRARHESHASAASAARPHQR
jgi:hypothetical protein